MTVVMAIAITLPWSAKSTRNVNLNIEDGYMTFSIADFATSISDISQKTIFQANQIVKSKVFNEMFGRTEQLPILSSQSCMP